MDALADSRIKGQNLTPILEVFTARKRGNKKQADDSGSKDLKYTLQVFYDIDQQSKAVATSTLTPGSKGYAAFTKGAVVSTWG